MWVPKMNTGKDLHDLAARLPEIGLADNTRTQEIRTRQLAPK